MPPCCSLATSRKPTINLTLCSPSLATSAATPNSAISSHHRYRSRNYALCEEPAERGKRTPAPLRPHSRPSGGHSASSHVAKVITPINSLTRTSLPSFHQLAKNGRRITWSEYRTRFCRTHPCSSSPQIAQSARRRK